MWTTRPGGLHTYARNSPTAERPHRWNAWAGTRIAPRYPEEHPIVTPRLFVVIAVAFVLACGGRTPPPSAPNRAAAPAVPESNPSAEYVVGPCVTNPPTTGEDGVRTYYLVRN
jgi:hypothetical protein